MLYTEDFTMRHFVGFSQIGSQLDGKGYLKMNIYINNTMATTKAIHIVPMQPNT